MPRPLLVLVIWLLIVLVGPWIAPADPMRTTGANAYRTPSAAAPFGFDALGRDVLSRALYGGPRTLLTALLSTAIALSGGLVLGLLAADSRWGGVGRGAITVLLTLPGLVLALVLVTLLGTRGGAVVIAVGLSQIAPVARLVQIVVRAAAAADYVTAARMLGAAPVRILRVHMLPNSAPPIAAYGLVIFSYSLLNVAGLSFLGLTGDLSTPDWGVMLAEARSAFRAAPWIGILPGLGITITVYLAGRAASTLTNRRG